MNEIILVAYILRMKLSSIFLCCYEIILYVSMLLNVSIFIYDLDIVRDALSYIYSHNQERHFVRHVIKIQERHITTRKTCHSGGFFMEIPCKDKYIFYL